MVESHGTGAHFSIHTRNAHLVRYHGLLNRSVMKNLRDRFFRFLDFLGTVAASQTTPIFVLGIISALQFAVLSLIPANRQFLGHNDRPARMVLNVLLIVLSVIPVGREDNMFLMSGRSF
jgi:hypothetical protein